MSCELRSQGSRSCSRSCWSCLSTSASPTSRACNRRSTSSPCSPLPSRHHRLEFRQQDKEHIVRTGNRIIILGLGLLAVAMTGAVVFITDVLYKGTTVWIVGLAAAAAFAIFWFLIPLRRRAASAGSGRSEQPARG